jgi:imidazole glycerol-phosphate synthase subunit HisH
LSKTVAVLDYGSGNIHSACRALEEAGAEVVLTKDRRVALEAHGMLLPGVGAYASVMEKLNHFGAEALIDQRLSAGRHVLGICVGMQVMFESGSEHGVETAGLGQWPGRVEMLSAPTLPNIGWSTIEVSADTSLFKGVEDEHFYFVHSYAAKSWDLQIEPPFISAAVSFATHGERFLAAVENGPLSATQFHPEKSGPAGLHLLRNWIQGL